VGYEEKGGGAVRGEAWGKKSFSPGKGRERRRRSKKREEPEKRDRRGTESGDQGHGQENLFRAGQGRGERHQSPGGGRREKLK